jgi:Fic family protein
MVQPDIESELFADSVIEEAWASNVIEGAFTTQKRAQELVRQNLPPRDKHELMMKNNYQAMLYILEQRQKNLTVELILEIHRRITQDTLDDPKYSGSFRDGDVFIRDKTGALIFQPMAAAHIEACLRNLVEWANHQAEKDFVHPVVKACIIHFYLVFVHPFSDGNGRTARALFYFYLLQHGYDFFKYFSISAIIANQREKYYKAIKEVEDHDNDLTYFLLYSTDTVMRSINEISSRITKKYMTDRIYKMTDFKGIILNKRQRKILKMIIERDIKVVTTRSYEKIMKVSYGTARSDLNDMAAKGLLQKQPHGKGFLYSAILEEFLRR